MAYLVLARKYRPRRFDDMVGQDHVARTLGHALAAGRIHHAYLFAGIRGLGKTTAARIVARALVCERGPAKDPCDACEGCRLALADGHPDIVEIDGASHNKVDDVRDLRQRVHYMPQLAARKVYIVDEVHMLSTSAFNALLKTLEEPPAHVHFLFATTEVHKLPATILSRVCRLEFRRVDEGRLAAHLASIAEREGLAVDEGALRLVARASEGSVRDAMTLLDQVIAFADGETIRETDAREVLGLSEPESIAALVDAVADRDAARALAALDEILAAGRDVGAVAVQLLEHLRTLAVFARCGAEALAATPGEIERLRAQAERAGDVTRIQGWFDRLAHTLGMLAGHPTPRLLVEMAVLDLATADALDDVLRVAASLAAGGGVGPAAGGGAGPAATTGTNAPRSATAAPPAPARSAATPAAAPTPRPAPRGRGRTPPDDDEALAASLRDALAGAAAPGPRSAAPREPRAQPAPPATAAGEDPDPDPPAAGGGARAGRPPTTNPQATGHGATEARSPTGAPTAPDPGAAGGPTATGREVPAGTTIPPAAGGDRAAPGPAAGEATGDGEDDESAAAPETVRGAPPTSAGAVRPVLPPGWSQWEDFVQTCLAQDPLAGSVLREVGFGGLEAGALSLWAAPTDFAREQLCTPGPVATLFARARAAAFGADVTVRWEDQPPRPDRAPSLAQVEATRAEDARNRARTEALADPSLRRLLETFEAAVVEAEPDAGPSP